MGASHQATWADLPRKMAEAGYLALTYDNRYWATPTRVDDTLLSKGVEDLRAVVDYARGQGAQRIILIGASLGGMATGKVAADLNPAAVIIMASPLNHANLPLELWETISARLPHPSCLCTG